MVERFTDEELAFLRHAKFGQLPTRVLPQDRIELSETDAPRDRPDQLANPDEWALRLGAGG